MPTFQLSTADRITMLEAELFSLCSKHPSFTPVVKTRAQRAQELLFTASIEDVEEIPPVHKPTPAVTDLEALPLCPIIATVPLIVIMDKPFEDREHLFQNARDATYAPPTT